MSFSDLISGKRQPLPYQEEFLSLIKEAGSKEVSETTFYTMSGREPFSEKDYSQIVRVRTPELAQKIDTAFGYIARMMIAQRIPVNRTCALRGLPDAAGFNILLRKFGHEENSPAMLVTTEAISNSFLLTGESGENNPVKVAEAGWFHALLDEIGQTGNAPENEQDVKDLLSVRENREFQSALPELLELMETFRKKFLSEAKIMTKKSSVYYAPTFGLPMESAGGGFVSGVAIDGALYEFTTAPTHECDTNMVTRLLGYSFFRIADALAERYRYGKDYEYFMKKSNGMLDESSIGERYNDNGLYWLITRFLEDGAMPVRFAASLINELENLNGVVGRIGVYRARYGETERADCVDYEETYHDRIVESIERMIEGYRKTEETHL